MNIRKFQEKLGCREESKLRTEQTCPINLNLEIKVLKSVKSTLQNESDKGCRRYSVLLGQKFINKKTWVLSHF